MLVNVFILDEEIIILPQYPLSYIVFFVYLNTRAIHDHLHI